MHVYDGEGFRPVAGREDWYREAMCVFEGEFSVEADKARLVDVVLGLHARGIRGDAGPPSLPPSPLNRLSEYETTASSLNEFTLASPTATPCSTTASPRASDALVSPGSRASSRRSLQRVDSAVRRLCGYIFDESWRRRGCDVDIPRRRRRRGCDVDIPRRRRLRRGYAVATGRGRGVRSRRGRDAHEAT